MDGSDKCLAFMTWKSKNLHYFPSAATMLARYRHIGKAWMTLALFHEWVVEFECMERQKRKVALFLDNCSVAPLHAGFGVWKCFLLRHTPRQACSRHRCDCQLQGALSPLCPG
ncbi:hypothetical protein HPB50_005638 [Hyalomma asiaticum]|uniref:Uncharacterized protein n=1 Tax=Hyalomma asiaticum TaxID=266040 RepID=A0ACB7TDH5_HYAAI|nr:hypothetical protein HPB50_005638 [Hyalomma asiaticum]